MGILQIVFLILVSAFWGVHAVIGQIAARQLGSFSLTVWRFTFGAVIYAPMVIRMRRMHRRTLWHLALTGIFWAVFYPLFFYRSLRYITPVESLILINTAPLIAAALGWLVLGERLRWTQGLGIGIAFIGVGWTGFGQWNAHGSVMGILFVLISAFAFAAYTVGSRSLARKLPLLDMVAAISIFGAVELWIVTVFSGQTRDVLHSLARLNGQGWEALLYVVLIVSTLSYILYGYGVKKVPSALSSALTFYPQVIFAALVQWIWLRIMPTWPILFSAIFILGGVVAMQWPKSRSKTTSAAK